VLDIYTTPLEILYISVILFILKSLDMRIKLTNNTVHSWPLQEAKNKLSQLVVRAQQGKPQYITKRGQEAAVLISMEEYRRVHQPAQPFNEFLIAAPLVDDIETERMPASLRDIEL
jgi:prevent-host-death family protein